MCRIAPYNRTLSSADRCLSTCIPTTIHSPSHRIPKLIIDSYTPTTPVFSTCTRQIIFITSLFQFIFSSIRIFVIFTFSKSNRIYEQFHFASTVRYNFPFVRFRPMHTYGNKNFNRLPNRLRFFCYIQN